jgi:polar amino acid transport system substrate-binding protein
MRAALRASFALVGLFLCLFVGTRSAHAEVLRWGADAEGGAPYVFEDANEAGKTIGFEVEIAAALGREIGAEIRFTQYDYKSLLPGLDRGDIDLAMNGIEITPERKDKVLFSKPYYVYTLQLVVRRGDARFRTLEQAKAQNAVIATLEETAAERLLDAKGVQKKIYDGQVEPYTDCQLGRVDGVLLDLPIAQYYAAPNDKLELVGDTFGKGYYAIAMRRDQVELGKRIDAGIDRLIKSGELRKIYEKWRIYSDDQQELATASVNDVMSESKRAWTVGKYLPLLLEGAFVTIQISFAGMALAILIGLPLALMRLYGSTPLKMFATTYVEFFRGIPVLLLLYFLYYGLPGLAEAHHWSVSLRLSPISASVLGFGLNYAAYEAEIYRAGIGAIPRGQWDAASCLGMSRGLAFRRVILPQAIRLVLPPMTNDFVALFKDTSVVSVIAVVELSKQYQILSKSSMKYVEIGAATAALYLIMSVPLGYLSRRLEKHWGTHA